MSRFQGATFDISGRVAQIMELESTTRVSIAVNIRAPDPKAPSQWVNVSTDFFTLAVVDPGLRAYLKEVVTTGDLLSIKGTFGSTTFPKGQAGQTATGIKMIPTHLSAVPKRQADRLDAQPPQSQVGDAGAQPNF